MDIAICGYTGFIGSRLMVYLQKQGYRVKGINRNVLNNPNELIHEFKKVDCVINLIGESVFGLWTKYKRKKIYTSRVESTSKIVKALNAINNGKIHLVNASGINIYDSSHTHDESSMHYAENFLANTVNNWELEALKYNGMVTITRFGVVLSREGGFLAVSLPLFRVGLGTVFGSGKQYFSYVTLNDCLKALGFLILNSTGGVYNLCDPRTSSNYEFSKVLAKTLNRPLILKVPAWMIKFFGGQTSVLLLEGQDVRPKKLLDEGFKFQYNSLEETINALISQD